MAYYSKFGDRCKGFVQCDFVMQPLINSRRFGSDYTASQTFVIFMITVSVKVA